MARPSPFAAWRHALPILAAGLLAAGPAAAGKAHQHGVVTMEVALEGAELAIGLEMPLDSVVGFERAPRTDAERQAAQAALARLRDAAALFRPDTAAGCSLAGVTVDAPVLTQGSAPRDGHADLNASIQFRCTQPARLGQLEVRLFDAFARVDRIEVQAVLPQGQRKAVLRRTARVLRLGP